MKRRSARPFVVEVKDGFRTGHTALRGVRTGDRSEDILWRGLLTGADAKPETRPSAALTSASASSRPASLPETAAPIARRILPNLMPPVGPEPEIADPEPVIRRRGPNRRGQAATVSSPTALVSIPASSPAPAAVPEPEAEPASTEQAGSRPAGRPSLAPTPRRPALLKPGERWKRRLSRFAR